MQTDMLIAALAHDAAAPEARGLGRRALGWTLLAALLVAVLAIAAMGLRPRLGWAMSTPPTLAKALLPLLVVLAALPAAIQRARPEAAVPPALRWMLSALGLVALLWFGLALAAMPRAGWPAALRGHSAPFCFVAIPVMALPVLAALIAALGRGGASTAPRISGALAGLAAGGLAAAIYALHCTEDAPLFFLTWYGLGILATAALGGMAGRRWLNW